MEEEKNDDTGAARILRGWIGEGRARQADDGSVQLVDNQELQIAQQQPL